MIIPAAFAISQLHLGVGRHEQFLFRLNVHKNVSNPVDLFQNPVFDFMGYFVPFTHG